VFKLFLNGGVDSFVIKEWWNNCNILNFYVLHGSTVKFTRGGEKYIHFVDNSLLFPTVKEFSKSVNS